jgi:hypothetical protein
VHQHLTLRRIFACRFLSHCAESRLARALLGAWDHRRRIRGDLNRASGHRERIDKGVFFCGGAKRPHFHSFSTSVEMPGCQYWVTEQHECLGNNPAAHGTPGESA